MVGLLSRISSHVDTLYWVYGTMQAGRSAQIFTLCDQMHMAHVIRMVFCWAGLHAVAQAAGDYLVVQEGAQTPFLSDVAAYGAAQRAEQSYVCDPSLAITFRPVLPKTSIVTAPFVGRARTVSWT